MSTSSSPKETEAVQRYFARDMLCLLGLPFDLLDIDDAARLIQAAAEYQRACFFSTPNLNFIVNARSDPNFRDSVIDSDLSVADGMSIVLVARILGIPIRKRVAGSDLFVQLMRGAAPRLKVFFFGGEDGVAETACARLNAESNGLSCVGFYSPGFGSVDEMSTDDILARINASGANFIVVSLGAKKGQAWIERNRTKLSAPVISHLGAVLNFVAGTVSRAPVNWQKCGFEWLWRIKEEPSLWRRYASDGLVLLSILLTRVLPYAWYRMRYQSRTDEPVANECHVKREIAKVTITLGGAWTRANISLLRQSFVQAALANNNVTLNFQDVPHIDENVVGLLMLLDGYLRQHGRRFEIVEPQKQVRRIIRYCCAEYLLSN